MSYELSSPPAPLHAGEGGNGGWIASLRSQ